MSESSSAKSSSTEPSSHIHNNGFITKLKNDLFKPIWLESWRTGGLGLLILALALAIAATTALGFSNQQVNAAVARQAAELLAGDAVLSNSEPIPAEWQQRASALNLKQSKVTQFSSMAYNQDRFVMVNVKAVDNAFPLRGQLQLSSAQPIQAGQVWLSPRAQDLLQVKVGQRLKIADAELTVAGSIVRDSNQEMGFAGFSPTVIIHQSDVAKTNAIQVGSRVDYRLLLAGNSENLKTFEQALRKAYPKDSSAETGGLRFRDASQANNRLLQPINNLDNFLQIATILTILLSGIAIALSSQRYVQQHQDHIALLRCMGAARRQILLSYLYLMALVAILSMLIGAALGVGFAALLLELMQQLLPQLQLAFDPWAMLMGPVPIAMLTSVVVLAGFMLPSIWQLINTAPLRVIRPELSKSSQLLALMLAGMLSLSLFCILLTQNWRLSLMLLAGIMLLLGSSYVLLLWLLQKIQRSESPMAAWVRRPQYSALQISALALALSLMAVLAVLRVDLLERWQQQLPANTPNQFVYGLPPFELQDFQAAIKQNAWSQTPLYPNIRGRLVAKNKQAFSAELQQQNNALRRELNLTQAKAFPSDNQLVAGQAQFTAVNQVSVEADLAQELGIQLGDVLRFNLPDGVLEAKVINLRTVKWESFSPNFFFIFSPNTLDANAGSYLGSFYVPEAEKPKLLPMIQRFSNTVFIDVGNILAEVQRIVAVLTQIIAVLAVLVAASGFLVLLACINLLLIERRREVAVLRAFGISKTRLKNMLTIEMGALGLAAGIVATLFAEVISAIACYKMQLPIQLHLSLWLVLPPLMALLCGLIGRYRLGYLCELPPLQSLRELS